MKGVLLLVLFLQFANCALTAETESAFEIPTSGQFDPALVSFDETVIGFMKRHEVPGGSLAIVQNGKLIYARGYGYADRETKTPVQPTSLFRLASVSKPITGVAIATLVEKKKLDLDAKVLELLKLEPHCSAGHKEDPRIRQITVRNLLQHSGGWNRDKSGDIMFKHFEIAKDMGIASPPDHNSLIRWGLGRQLDFDPGKEHAYSNFGYCILGRVIEKVTGMSYEDYVRLNVLAPMGITAMRIGAGHLSERAENEVHYYDGTNMKRTVFSLDGDTEVPAAYAFAWPYTMDAHGGWIASAVDMARFAAALDKPGGKPVLSLSAQARMYERPAGLLGHNAQGEPSAFYYGLGWYVRPVGNEGKANYWHRGAMPGTSTILVRMASGLSWVVLFNRRADGKGEESIDALLHKAAAKVKEWPDRNLFEK